MKMRWFCRAESLSFDQEVSLARIWFPSQLVPFVNPYHFIVVVIFSAGGQAEGLTVDKLRASLLGLSFSTNHTTWNEKHGPLPFNLTTRHCFRWQGARHLSVSIGALCARSDENKHPVIFSWHYLWPAGTQCTLSCSIWEWLWNLFESTLLEIDM